MPEATTETTAKPKRRKKPAASNDDAKQTTIEDRVAAVDHAARSTKLIALDLLDVHPQNPRGLISDEDVAELAASIRAHGQLQEIGVRPKAGGRWEILFGARRARALAVAGLLEARCVEIPVVDGAELEVTLTENVQRVDPHPMDDAEAFAALRERGVSVEELAGRLGKSPSFVQGRLRLLALCEEARTWYRAGSTGLVGAATLARLDHEHQRRALARLRRDTDQGEPVMNHAVRTAVARETRDLATVAWPLGKVIKGVDAPACSMCPQRTGAQTAIFADALDDADRCTDSRCFEQKRDAYVSQVTAKHRRAKGTVLEGDAASALLASYGGLTWDAKQTFVELDAVVGRDGEVMRPPVEDGSAVPTWSKAFELAGVEVSPKNETLLVDDTGRVRRLVSREVAREVAEKLWPAPVAPETTTSTTGETEGEEPEWKATERRRKALRAALAAAALPILRREREIEAPTLLRALALVALDGLLFDLDPTEAVEGTLEHELCQRVWGDDFEGDLEERAFEVFDDMDDEELARWSLAATIEVAANRLEDPIKKRLALLLEVETEAA